MRDHYPDPYLRAIDGLNKAGVGYVVVGVSGINYYAKDPSGLIITGDYDIFLAPEEKNVLAAARELKKQNFELSVSGRVFRPASVKNVVAAQKTIHAKNFYGCTIEFLLGISGYTYEEVSGDAVFFAASGVRVKVGRLEKLLKSKKIADRPKDRMFLERFKNVESKNAE